MNPADLAHKYPKVEEMLDVLESSDMFPTREALVRAITDCAIDALPELRALLAEREIPEGWQLVRRDVFNKLISTGTNFYAFVEGECPSLIEDDHNAYDFAFALAAAKETK
jgi:hypothetical protein